jgi:hypothetical protein
VDTEAQANGPGSNSERSDPWAPPGI